MKIYKESEVSVASRPLSKSDWIAVIPAAGRGSRLGHSQPKILYPIAGKAILYWLIDLLEPFVDKMVFILSASGVESVKPLLQKRLDNRFEIVIQDRPRGMADAISQVLPVLNNSQTLIIWGDQVGIRPETLTKVINLHQKSPLAQLTFPIVESPNPYVHYVQDKLGTLTGVLEKREGARLPKIGFTDCGVFAVATQSLKEVFQLEITQGIKYSQETKEWNFLPMLPIFESGKDSVRALKLTTPIEAIGVNNKEDAAQLDKFLRHTSS